MSLNVTKCKTTLDVDSDHKKVHIVMNSVNISSDECSSESAVWLSDFECMKMFVVGVRGSEVNDSSIVPSVQFSVCLSDCLTYAIQVTRSPVTYEAQFLFFV